MRIVIRLLILAVLAGIGGGGFWYWKTHQPAEDDSQLVLYGNIDIRQVELAINDNERIAIVKVEEGDRIKKGQLLARLETERFQYAVDRAAAQVETQRQVVARLVAGSRPEEIRRARAGLAADEATARDLETRYRRAVALRKKSAASQQDVDDAKGALDAALARTQSARATLDLAIAGPRKEDIAEAKALLKRYEAELAQATHDLEDAYLYAPSDGIVQDRILEAGDMASPQKPIYLVALTDPVWVRAYVSEPDLGKIHEGMPAAVTTDSFPGKRYDAWIGFISPTAEFTPKPVETREVRTRLVYQVRVFVRNPNNELRLGMPATVTVSLDHSEASHSSVDASAKPGKATGKKQKNGDARSQGGAPSRKPARSGRKN